MLRLSLLKKFLNNFRDPFEKNPTISYVRSKLRRLGATNPIIDHSDSDNNEIRYQFNNYSDSQVVIIFCLKSDFDLFLK